MAEAASLPPHAKATWIHVCLSDLHTERLPYLAFQLENVQPTEKPEEKNSEHPSPQFSEYCSVSVFRHAEQLQRNIQRAKEDP